MKQVICRDKTVWLKEANDITVIIKAEENVYWVWDFSIPYETEADLEQVIAEVASGKYDTAGCSEDTDLSGVYQTVKDFFTNVDEEDTFVVMSTYGYIANL